MGIYNGPCGATHRGVTLAANQFQWAEKQLVDGTAATGYQIGISYDPADVNHQIAALLPDERNSITVIDTTNNDQIRFVGLSTVNKIVIEAVPAALVVPTGTLPVGSIVSWSAYAVYMKPTANPASDYKFVFVQKARLKNGEVVFLELTKTKNY